MFFGKNGPIDQALSDPFKFHKKLRVSSSASVKRLFLVGNRFTTKLK